MLTRPRPALGGRTRLMRWVAGSAVGLATFGAVGVLATAVPVSAAGSTGDVSSWLATTNYGASSPTEVASLDLAAGDWLVTFQATFYSNTGGDSCVVVLSSLRSSSDAGSALGYALGATAGGNEVTVSGSADLQLTSELVVYLNAGWGGSTFALGNDWQPDITGMVAFPLSSAGGGGSGPTASPTPTATPTATATPGSGEGLTSTLVADPGVQWSVIAVGAALVALSAAGLVVRLR